jgi:hypothetical protein
MTVEELTHELLRLGVDDRARVATALIGSLDNLSSEENEALWLREAKRRSDDIKAGSAQTVSGREVFAAADGLLA